MQLLLNYAEGAPTSEIPPTSSLPKSKPESPNPHTVGLQEDRAQLCLSQPGAEADPAPPQGAAPFDLSLTLNIRLPKK